MNKEFKINLSQLKQVAFTLAETLIVMGIIGVVAALTLPNLNSSTGEKEKVAKVKKIYSNLEDALGRAQAVYGPFDEWCVNYSGSCRSRMFDRVTEFMKTSKVCNNISSCPELVFAANGNSAGDRVDNFDYKTHSVILSDGTTIGFNRYQNIGSIMIDIDGTNKGVNIEGKDVFKITYDNNGLSGSQPSDAPEPYEDNGHIYFDSEYALSWIISYGNMDYIKVDSDGKCPDGKTVLDGTTNTTCK